MANLLEARDWDYVVGSVHFLRDRALDTRGLRRLGRAASRPRRSGGATSRRSPRRRCTGLYDVIAHPDLVKVWGERAPRPDGDLRRFYEPAVEAFAEAGVAVEVSTAGPAQAGRRDLPGAAVPGDGRSTRAARSRCPATPTSPTSSATATRRRSSCSSELGVSELAVFERRAAADGADRVMAAPASASTRTASRRAPADPRRRRDPARAGPGRATPTPTCSPTRSSTRCSAPPGSATSASTSPTPTSAGATPTRSSCCAASSRSRRRGSSHVDATVMMERPKLSPHRDAIRASLAGASLGCTRQRQGDDRRGDGLRRPRRGRRGAGGGDAARLVSGHEAPARPASAARPPRPPPRLRAARRRRSRSRSTATP